MASLWLRSRYVHDSWVGQYEAGDPRPRAKANATAVLFDGGEHDSDLLVRGHVTIAFHWLSCDSYLPTSTSPDNPPIAQNTETLYHVHFPWYHGMPFSCVFSLPSSTFKTARPCLNRTSSFSRERSGSTPATVCSRKISVLLLLPLAYPSSIVPAPLLPTAPPSLRRSLRPRRPAQARTGCRREDTLHFHCLSSCFHLVKQGLPLLVFPPC